MRRKHNKRNRTYNNYNYTTRHKGKILQTSAARTHTDT